MHQTYTAQNDLYQVEIDAQHGLIRRIFDRAGGIELITEPPLVENYSLIKVFAKP